mmetsp:Transcript_11785/g.28133  ORF Transcript_11785/g.28133 Transcript_11785/m.28133 type:complete len:208 (-) Transcript_11785:141-764(-)
MLSTNDHLGVHHDVSTEEQSAEGGIDEIGCPEESTSSSAKHCRDHEHEAATTENQSSSEEVGKKSCEVVLCLASKERQSANTHGCECQAHDHGLRCVVRTHEANHDSFGHGKHCKQEIVRRILSHGVWTASENAHDGNDRRQRQEHHGRNDLGAFHLHFQTIVGDRRSDERRDDQLDRENAVDLPDEAILHRGALHPDELARSIVLV